MKYNFLRGTPAHQRIFPSFSGIKIDFPIVDVVGARLHSIFWRLVDTNFSCFDVLLGRTGYHTDILNFSHSYVSMFQLFGSLQIPCFFIG